MNIRDDRGTSVEVRGDSKGRTRSGWAAVDALALMVVCAIVGVMVVFLAAFTALIATGASGQPSASLSLVAATLIGPLVSIALAVIVNRIRRKRLASDDSCVACGYELTSLEVEPDGCRVCPECGAAWRASTSGGDA